jgi:TPR repeat protein
VEREKQTHGAFFEAVIHGLRGKADVDRDGQIVLPELELFVKKQVAEALKANKAQQQTPELVGRPKGLLALAEGPAPVVGWFLHMNVEIEQPTAGKWKVPHTCQEVRLLLAGSAADRGGLKKGDVILEVNGQKTTDGNQLIAALEKAAADARVKLSIVRDGEHQQLTVVLSARPPGAELVAIVQQRAEQDDTEAMLQLGRLFNRGEYGVPKDDAKAVEWYRKAAEKGNHVAQVNLGIMYEKGHGVAKDEARAVEWYRKAAEKGNARAQFALGLMYTNGHGVGRDEGKAVEWYRKAAEQGYARAQGWLGVMYTKNLGVTKDDAKAVEWYRMAAEQGEVFAQYNLAVMYINGHGVAKDRAEAIQWLRRAAELGHEPARQMLRSLGVQ